MARPLRLCFPGACYHVMVRGNAKGLLFLDDHDRRKLVEVLAETVRRYALVVHAFCFMPNHVHLVVQTRTANLSSALAFLVGVYAQWWNRRHGRCGHVTQGRFKAQLIQNEQYLAAACRYVMDNPVRAGLAERPEQWEWSSYRAAAGLAPAPWFLDASIAGRAVERSGGTDVVPRVGHESADCARYDREVARAIRGEARFVGAPALPDSHEHAAEQARLAGLSRREWRALTPPLAEIFGRYTDTSGRNRAMLDAHLRWGYPQVQIAGHLGLHHDVVGRLIRGLRRRRQRVPPTRCRRKVRGSGARRQLPRCPDRAAR